jgi:two-component system, NtrC family, response regulator HydG
VDVRIVTATNQVLLEKVNRGEFRKDLYFRLKVAEIHLPPLRERKQDIPMFIDHFLREFNRRFHKRIIDVSVDVEEIFMN